MIYVFLTQFVVVVIYELFPPIFSLLECMGQILVKNGRFLIWVKSWVKFWLKISWEVSNLGQNLGQILVKKFHGRFPIWVKSCIKLHWQVGASQAGHQVLILIAISHCKSIASHQNTQTVFPILHTGSFL